MTNIIEVKKPTQFYTAKQLSEMNYTEMMEKLSAQENQYTKDQGIGGMASEILHKVSQGEIIAFRDISKKTRKYKEYYVGDMKIDKRFLMQLEKRGFLELPE